MTTKPAKDYCFDLVVFGQVSIDTLHCTGGVVTRIGGVAYASSTATRLGLNTGIVSVVGSEQLEKVQSILVDRSVSTHWITIKGPGIAYEIWSADEVVPQSTVRTGSTIPTDLKLPSTISEHFCRAALVYPVSTPLALDFINRVKETAHLVAVDLQHDVHRLEDFETFASLVDIVFVSKASLLSLTGCDNLKTAIQIASAKSKKAILVVKLGMAGSVVVLHSGELIQVPAYLSAFQCTVGAGDAYDAAFLSELLGGATHAEAAHFAAKVASIVIESLEQDPSESVSCAPVARCPVGLSIDLPPPYVYIAGHFHSLPLAGFIEHLAAALENIGFRTYVPHRDGGIVGIDGVSAGSAFRDDVDALDSCSGVVALLDGAGRGGTFFELGYLYGRSCPIFAICTDRTLGISNMVTQSSRIITADLRHLLNEVLRICGNLTA